MNEPQLTAQILKLIANVGVLMMLLGICILCGFPILIISFSN